ncbi:MAG: Rv3235 family protein [Pseudonocardiaceae bacterium]|nr:Rv3235 family protein [Pseudonocardiaceae bacterium]
MTASIAESYPELPQRPVLRRLVDVLPAATPATVTLPPATALAAADPAAAVLAERVLRAAVEILGGRRPARQLSAVLGPDLLRYLVSLQMTAGHLKPRMHRVFVQHHAGGATEAVALVTLTTGVRALAARFDKHGSRWQCTALQLRLTSGDLKAAVGGRRNRMGLL